FHKNWGKGKSTIHKFTATIIFHIIFSLSLLRCECGACQSMGTLAECVCCVETQAVNFIRESSDLECITHHQTFIDNCLNVRVLEVSLHDYIQRDGPLDDNEPIYEVYRHIAYRRFVLWIWHKLGKGNRKVQDKAVISI
ncbi:uncharacterized protein LOC144622019, partial [Crassostrea virginica]